MVPTPASWEAWFLLLGEHDSCSLLLPTLGDVVSAPHSGVFVPWRAFFFNFSARFYWFFIFSTTTIPYLLVSSSTRTRSIKAQFVFLSIHFYINHPLHHSPTSWSSGLWLSISLVSVFSFPFPPFLVMAPRDNVARKKKRIDKYPASKISKKLRDKLIFEAVESSS